MKKTKILIIICVFTLLVSTLKVSAYSPIGVSVFLPNMFSVSTTGYHEKSTSSSQTFHPFTVTNDRQGYVALLGEGGTSTDGLWHAFNKVNGEWDYENFTCYACRLSDNSYSLSFKTTGLYIGGTGITGFWYID